jgi:hypothetical protein
MVTHFLLGVFLKWELLKCPREGEVTIQNEGKAFAILWSPCWMGTSLYFLRLFPKFPTEKQSCQL